MLGIPNHVGNKNYSYFTIYFGVHRSRVFIVNLIYNELLIKCVNWVRDSQSEKYDKSIVAVFNLLSPVKKFVAIFVVKKN